MRGNGNGRPAGPWADLPPLVGTSPAILRAQQLIERYAPTSLSIIIIGPTGAGKELLARHVHARSGRRGRFVPVNCGALPGEMVESLLFGHRRGAFSGAVETRRGHVDRAHGGTLFLDEVLSLIAECQAKLLRALDTGEVQPLGEEEEHFVDLRVVAAAQDVVWAGLDSGTFRSDLYQRIAGVLIVLPPLVERPEDIIPIARHFATAGGRWMEADAERVLEGHRWPGNVRELRQVIERAGQLVVNGTLPREALAEAIALGARPIAATLVTLASRMLSRQEVLAACEAKAWDVDEVAALFGVRRSRFYERLRASGISLRELRLSGLSGLSTGRGADRPDVHGDVIA